MSNALDNVCGFVLRQCHDYPDRIAIDLGDDTLTYKELASMVSFMASRLMESGVTKGQLVMVASENELNLLVTVLAVSAVGGVCMVLRRQLPPREVEKYADKFHPHLIVTDHHGYPLDAVRKIFINVGDLRADVAVSCDQNPLKAENLMGANDDPVGLVVGSGSTGESKIIRVTHRQKLAQLQTRAHAFEFRPGDKVASLTHVQYQAARRHLFSALSAGCTVMLYPKGNVAEVLNVLRSDVTVLNVPGILLHDLVQKFAGQKRLLPDLRIMNTAGSLTSDELRHAVDKYITPHLHVVYATNEIGFLTMAKPDDWRQFPGSVGRPLLGVEMEIVDKQGQPVAKGQPGHLRFRKPEMMTEYMDAPELTRRSFKHGWFYPHDIGSLGEEGVLRFYGRADDMMIFNGINVYPLEIERCMRELAGIKDVAAFPLRHPAHQDVPVCAVVIEEGSALDEAQMMEWGRRFLGTVAPKHVFILDKIPRDGLGKLLRPQLRETVADMLEKLKDNA